MRARANKHAKRVKIHFRRATCAPGGRRDEGPRPGASVGPQARPPPARDYPRCSVLSEFDMGLLCQTLCFCKSSVNNVRLFKCRINNESAPQASANRANTHTLREPSLGLEPIFSDSPTANDHLTQLLPLRTTKRAWPCAWGSTHAASSQRPRGRRCQGARRFHIQSDQPSWRRS